MTFRLLLSISLLTYCFSASSLADVKGLDGNIGFDVDSNGTKEMRLNATGLGIGTNPSSNLHINGNVVISQKIGIGTTNATANLSLQGSLSMGLETFTNDGNIENSSIVLADSSTGNIDLNLPYAGNVAGRTYTIKKTTTENDVWVYGGGNLIDDKDWQLLPSSTNYPMIKTISNGSQWNILTSYETGNSTVATGNLVGWWKLDETSGTSASDDSGQGNDGSFQGGADFSSNVTTRGLNQAIQLDGDDDYVSIPDDSSLTFGDGSTDQPFSVSVWVNTLNAASNAGVLSKADNFNSGEYYLLIATYQVYFRIVDDSASSYKGIVSTSTINNNTWYHLVGTYDGSGLQAGLKLYINGELQSTNGSNAGTYTAMEASGITLRLGRRNTSLNGSIDDARVYSKELNADEVLKIYRNDL